MDVEEQINNICKKVPAFIPLYNARVRHYIIKQHIINVYNQFEKYFSKDFNKAEIEWFTLFLLLHDIGKSVAYKKGNRDNQIIETIILLEQNSPELGLSEEYLILFNSLLRASSIGKYMESKISLDDTFNNIVEQSEIATIKAEDFFYLLSVYYQCDIASYTGDAGGIPFLEHLFEYQNREKVYCEKTQLLKLAEPYAQKYNTLFNKIKEISDSSNTKKLDIKKENFNIKVVGKIDLSKFEKPKKEIVKDKQNIYIIDTNVFVDYPNIISKIKRKYQVVLSAKVIDELDFLKISLTDEQKKNVQIALRQINREMDKKNVRMETANLELLPIDFDKRSPDNKILSVALNYKDENPIMLTSDNGLQIKAKGLGITTITLKNFLKQVKY